MGRNVRPTSPITHYTVRPAASRVADWAELAARRLPEQDPLDPMNVGQSKQAGRHSTSLLYCAISVG